MMMMVTMKRIHIRLAISLAAFSTAGVMVASVRGSVTSTNRPPLRMSMLVPISIKQLRVGDRRGFVPHIPDSWSAVQPIVRIPCGRKVYSEDMGQFRQGWNEAVRGLGRCSAGPPT